MTNRQVLWAVTLGSVLAVMGCGETSPAGSGGSGGSPPADSCPLICNSPCQIFEQVDPASPTCLADCADVGYNGCVSETQALVTCVEQVQGGDCSVDPNAACEAEGDAWGACPAEETE
jgi:hypothetical protein